MAGFIGALTETVGETVKKTVETAAEILENEIDELPEEIGQISEIDELPVEIGEEVSERSLESENNGFNTEDIKEEEEIEKQGGSYGEVFKEGEGDKYEVHHMPADSVSFLERTDGPAIKMEKADHKQTASWGSSREAMEYRNIQKELIDNGRFEEAIQMDIDDIHDKFGDKYDGAISEMLEYVEVLKQEGEING